MGVKGLTTYMEDRADVFFTKHELKDTKLVIDGNNIACQLSLGYCGKQSRFGGDYNKYYNVVLTFFNHLKQCNITPIVIFDGGYEQRKLDTVKSRHLQCLKRLEAAAVSSYENLDMFPLFMKQVFLDVMMALKVTCIQCPFEADSEIAGLARYLNCPVLSYDSDFFLSDVLYIPFPTLGAQPVQNQHSRFHLKCDLYKIEHFLGQFQGLKKSVLPFLGPLLGNDYINAALFQQFFNHIKITKGRDERKSQKKIHSVLHWLKNETIESATENILLHVGKNYHEAVLSAINDSVAEYTAVSSYQTTFRGGLDLLLPPQRELLGLPESVVLALHQCNMNCFFMDLISLNTTIMQLQVEDLTKESPHTLSLPILVAIYKILKKLSNKKDGANFYVNMRVKNKMVDFPLKVPHISVIDNLDSYKIVMATKTEQHQLLFQLLEAEEEMELVNFFPKSWQLYILSLVYWLKAEKELKNCHLQAITLTIVFLKVIENKIGYMKSLAAILKRLSTNNETPASMPGATLDELLQAVSAKDCLESAALFLSKSQNMTYSTVSISVIHHFATFQSCLHHVYALNSLLMKPLEPFKISEFYNGTLLYNLYEHLKSSSIKQDAAKRLFKGSKVLEAIYDIVTGKLSYLVPDGLPNQVKKNGKRIRKQKAKALEAMLSSVTLDETDW